MQILDTSKKNCYNLGGYAKYVAEFNIMLTERGIFKMGKFVIKTTKSGGYTFNLKARNGEIIATGENYESLDSCKNGVNSVITNAPIAALEDQTVEGYQTEKNPKFEVYKDKAGEFRFRLKAKNGQIIATGEGYKAKSSCKDGIESIRKNAVDSEIVEEA